MDLRVRETSSLTVEVLTALVMGEVAVVVVRNWLSKRDLPELLARIEAAAPSSEYSLTRDFVCLGRSMGEADRSPEDEEIYLSSAADDSRFIREHIFQGSSPWDEFRAQVSGFWGPGTELAEKDGRPFAECVVRNWTEGCEAKPHIDVLDTELLKPYRLGCRIGVNYFIDAPSAGAGGEMLFWQSYDSTGYAQLERDGYGISAAAIGEPRARLTPGRGDLILIDASVLHAVSPVLRGTRTTLATFVGYGGHAQPLIFFA